MDVIVGFALFALLIGAVIGALLPRFSAYFFGPLLLIIGLLAGITLARANLHTEGSPAGVVIGGILVLAMVVGSAGGLALTVVGALSLRKRADGLPEAPPPAP
jgi:hypothetical protein